MSQCWNNKIYYHPSFAQKLREINSLIITSSVGFTKYFQKTENSLFFYTVNVQQRKRFGWLCMFWSLSIPCHVNSCAKILTLHLVIFAKIYDLSRKKRMPSEDFSDEVSEVENHNTLW